VGREVHMLTMSTYLRWMDVVKIQMLGLIKVTVNTNQVDIVDLLEKDYDDKEDIFEHVSTC